MRFALLASGSRGNATLICAGRTRVLLDCGLALGETRRRLARFGIEPESLTAIVVTHEHSDHLSGVGALARHCHLPVWTTSGTLSRWRDPADEQLHLFNPHEPFVVDDLEIMPYPVPHDAREPAQFVFGDGHVRLGVLSDAGSVTAHMRARLSACDALLLEFNHDARMLAEGPYPPILKQRVGGAYGHLSNDQAADLLRTIDCSHLQHLVLTHLSEKNNTPDHARTAAAAALDCDPAWIACASQDAGLDWRTVN